MLPVRLFGNEIWRRHHEPRGSLARWPGDLEELVDRFFGTPSIGGFRVDVREEGDNLIVEAELPGFRKDEIAITVEDDVLTISGETKGETEEKKPNYHIQERRYGRVCRSFNLPSTADSEKVSANLKDGVLTVSIPKREEAKPRQIEVK